MLNEKLDCKQDNREEALCHDKHSIGVYRKLEPSSTNGLFVPKKLSDYSVSGGGAYSTGPVIWQGALISSFTAILFPPFNFVNVISTTSLTFSLAFVIPNAFIPNSSHLTGCNPIISTASAAAIKDLWLPVSNRTLITLSFFPSFHSCQGVCKATLSPRLVLPTHEWVHALRGSLP